MEEKYKKVMSMIPFKSLFSYSLDGIYELAIVVTKDGQIQQKVTATINSLEDIDQIPPSQTLEVIEKAIGGEC